MKQLTLEGVVGSFDYTETSTVDKFLKRNSVMTYSVEFYEKYGKIEIITTYISDRTLEGIMHLD
ncbi:hypothetical protein [Bacillus sp. RC206]|uniref:hypothetical protein n=1 Tax=Bacillus sp. RC206 TaxID=3156281 RepID=UPI001C339234|nr:hypothetical protein JG486_31245 [Bacillus mycoides]